MINCKRKIALIYGGQGCEHSVSLAGAEHVREVISKEKYDTVSVLIEKSGRWTVDGREVFPTRRGAFHGLSDGERLIPIDCAIPLLHGDYGEDGRIQGALDTAGIPFVGADVVAGAVCIDKGFTRSIAEQIGIPIARGISLPRRTDFATALGAAREIGFPIFVKPRRLGSSVGAGIARNEGELSTAFIRAALYGEILIEELIEEKRELEIGVLSLRGRCVVSPVGEVLCDGFYDFDKKYRGTTKTVCPADLDGHVSEKIREYTLRLLAAISLFGTARIDFFLSGGRLIFNEINTIPGFTRDSLYPSLMRAAGIGDGELFDLLIEDALPK